MKSYSIMFCEICNSHTEAIIHKSIKYYKCLNCKFIFKDKRYYLSESQEKKRYLQHNNSLSNEGYINWLKSFLNEAVNPYLSSDSKVLDFGSGPCPVLPELINQPETLIDVFDKFFAMKEDYLNRKYDYIIMLEVIEHISTPLKTLKKLKNILNPKGKIGISTLLHQENDNTFKNWWYKEDKTHVSFFSSKTFIEIADILSFKIIKTNNKNLCVFELV